VNPARTLIAVSALVGLAVWASPAQTPAAKKVEIVKQQPKVTHPLPRPKPKVVKKKEKKKAKAKPKKRGETFCERVRREYERMSWAERWAAYQRATPQQVAAGRRCLGM
jgi:outer membrane biosynthesis protein TonB